MSDFKEPKQIPQLGYWDIRGLGEPIRMLLGYCGVEFEDVFYSLREEDLSQIQWRSVKFSLGLDFPNLPYYIDENIKLSETSAILSYLAEKHNMNGSTAEQRAKMTMTYSAIMSDIKVPFVRMSYTSDKETFEQLKKELIETTLPAKLELWEKYLSKQKFMADDETVTYVDFVAYEIFVTSRHLAPEVFEKFPNVQAYIKRVEDLPALQAYWNSDKHKKLPINSKVASFGYTIIN